VRVSSPTVSDMVYFPGSVVGSVRVWVVRLIVIFCRMRTVRCSSPPGSELQAPTTASRLSCAKRNGDQSNSMFWAVGACNNTLQTHAAAAVLTINSLPPQKHCKNGCLAIYHHGYRRDPRICYKHRHFRDGHELTTRSRRHEAFGHSRKSV
jgi:hypothetical protein